MTTMICDRCPNPTTIYRVSWFNTADTICPDCQKQEEAHPDYEYAKQAEKKAVRAGDTLFPGVGWPGVHGRVGHTNKK